MIVLDATTKSLQFKLGGAVTANQLPFSTSYFDSTATTTTLGEQDGASNNTTAVTIASAPASSTQRAVKSVTIQNADTAAATVTVLYNNNSTLRNLFIATLSVGDQLVYEDGQGWAVLDKNGNLKTATSSTVSQAALQPYLPGGLINKFRNGTMDVWQRGASSITVSTAGAYTADGWIVQPTGASCTAQQSTSNARTGALSTYSLLMTGAASVTDILLKQRIESVIAQQLEGQTVTVQAEVYNNTGGSITPTLTVKHANAADNWSATTTDVNAASLQTCPNGGWTQVAYTFQASTASGNGLEITFDFGNNFSSTAKSVQVTELDIRATPGVSTGLNSSPPIPEMRPIFAELAFNQRYYETSYGNNVAPGAVTTTGMVTYIAYFSTGAQSIAGGFVGFKVPKRATPTITYYSNNSGTSGKIYDGVATADVAATNNQAGTDGLNWQASPTANGQIYFQFQWTANAEL
jgi:hypothetical protein